MTENRIGDTMGTQIDMIDLIMKSIEDERADYRRVLEEIYNNEGIELDGRHATQIREVLNKYVPEDDEDDEEDEDAGEG